MMTKITVEKLVALGGKRWQKGNMDRVYFNYEELANFYGLKYDGWKFTVDGEKVSNNSGRYFASALRNGKFWFDLTTGEFASKYIDEKITAKIIDRITEAVTKMTEAETKEAETKETETKETETKEAETKTDEPEVAEAAEASAPKIRDVRTAVGPGLPPGVKIYTNRKPGYCRHCGKLVPAGQGHLYYIDPDEAYEVSGWIVEHMDKNICRAEINRRNDQLTARARLYSTD